MVFFFHAHSQTLHSKNPDWTFKKSCTVSLDKGLMPVDKTIRLTLLYVPSACTLLRSHTALHTTPKRNLSLYSTHARASSSATCMLITFYDRNMQNSNISSSAEVHVPHVLPFSHSAVIINILASQYAGGTLTTLIKNENG